VHIIKLKSSTFAVRLLGERLRILRGPCVNSSVFGRALRFVNHGSAQTLDCEQGIRLLVRSMCVHNSEKKIVF